ncbi:MAG: hypothetical protein NTW72_06285 [Gemmatimonadetes bacterium]|nr:hypothetical protein [Gemmatimonadota bacterium]
MRRLPTDLRLRTAAALDADSAATLRVAWKDVALQFADALTRLRTPGTPAASNRLARPVPTSKATPLLTPGATR